MANPYFYSHSDGYDETRDIAAGIFDAWAYDLQGNFLMEQDAPHHWVDRAIEVDPDLAHDIATTLGGREEVEWYLWKLVDRAQAGEFSA